MHYQPDELIRGLYKITKFFNRNAIDLNEKFLDENDLVFFLNIGMLSLVLQLRNLKEEEQISISEEILDMAEICAAKVDNLSFSHNKWGNIKNWESAQKSFKKLSELFRANNFDEYYEK